MVTQYFWGVKNYRIVFIVSIVGCYVYVYVCVVDCRVSVVDCQVNWVTGVGYVDVFSCVVVIYEVVIYVIVDCFVDCVIK